MSKPTAEWPWQDDDVGAVLSGPIPDWPSPDEPVVIPLEFIPEDEDEGHADPSEVEA
jgi:hypothetical protein